MLLSKALQMQQDL
jgi:hypothetical protein